jgi:hypothetical protein
MSEAVVRFLTNLPGPAGTLLLLDDLQWASADALALLATLARSAAEVPVRLIGAYRDTEVRAKDPLAVLLDLSGFSARPGRTICDPHVPHRIAVPWASWPPQDARPGQRTQCIPHLEDSDERCVLKPDIASPVSRQCSLDRSQGSA